MGGHVLKTFAMIAGVVLMCAGVLFGVIMAMWGKWIYGVLPMAGVFVLGILLSVGQEIAQQQMETRRKKKEQANKTNTLKGLYQRGSGSPAKKKVRKDMLFCNRCSSHVEIYHESRVVHDRVDSAFDLTLNECKCKECHFVLKQDWSR
jgi:hypothetical protein